VSPEIVGLPPQRARVLLPLAGARIPPKPCRSHRRRPVSSPDRVRPPIRLPPSCSTAIHCAERLGEAVPRQIAPEGRGAGPGSDRAAQGRHLWQRQGTETFPGTGPGLRRKGDIA